MILVSEQNQSERDKELGNRKYSKFISDFPDRFWKLIDGISSQISEKIILKATGDYVGIWTDDNKTFFAAIKPQKFSH